MIKAIRENLACWVITLAIIGCSAIPFEIVSKDDDFDVFMLDGTIVSTCAVKVSGCEFQLARRGDHDIREVFVPWGTPLYNKVREIPQYTYVRAKVVDRGDGSFVLRSIKEVL